MAEKREIIILPKLSNTSFEYELQARIYEILKETQVENRTIEFVSSELATRVSEYFEHIGCKFIITDSAKQNIKRGKLVKE